MFAVRARMARVAATRPLHRCMSSSGAGATPTPAPAAGAPVTPAASSAQPAAASASAAPAASSDAAVPSFAASAAGTAASTSARSSRASPSLARGRRAAPPGWSGGAPQGAHFWKAGLPFLIFLALAAMGTASVLQPKIEAREGSMAQRLYGQTVEGDSDTGPADPNKKKTNVPAYGQPRPPRKLTSLEEEYEKAKKDFGTDYVNKRVPRVPGTSSGH